MKNNIENIWQQLESHKILQSGISKIRYRSDSFCDLFLGLKTPENERLLCVRVPLEYISKFKFIYNFKGLRFDIIYDPDDESFVFLNLILVDLSNKEIFNHIIQDIITILIELGDNNQIIKEYANRLTKWQTIFEKFNVDGLSPEEQRGLFGEIYFLREFMQLNTNFQQIVSSWVGSSKEIRDFQMNNWAVEVKTTYGSNHQKVHISSERQLDNTHIENLFLYHLSLEKAQEAGETLNEIVNSIYTILEDDIISSNRFKSKLYEAGYFVHHYNLYDSVGYFVRNDTFYKVENDFPRIQENEIRSGVGDIKYSIILSHCETYKQTTEIVFETLVL